jgi:ATP-dependent Lon protease
MDEKLLKGREVPLESLRWRCDMENFKFETTDDIMACDEIIGQDRALKAVKLGLEMKSIGYNIFISGFVGTGRNTAIKCLLERVEKEEKAPDDICFVNNFKNPDMPRVIMPPAGEGNKLKKALEELVVKMKTDVPSVFESENYQNRRKNMIEDYKEKEKTTVKEFEKKVEAENFSIIQVPKGPYMIPEIVPVVAGNAINLDQLEEQVETGKFPKEEFEKLKTKKNELSKELENLTKVIRDLQKEAHDRLVQLDDEFVFPVVKGAIHELKSRFSYEEVPAYLDDVQNHILENLDNFKEKEEEKAPILPGLPPAQSADPFIDYRVNVVVDNSETKGSPVIIETSPNYRNLFGSIERSMSKMGAWTTDFTKIKAGSLLRANKGYLVLNAIDVLIEPGVWNALKRTLRNKVIEIQSFDPYYLITTSALKPKPVEFDVKVVMIGSHNIYQLLYHYDEDFKKIFKVKADFDTVMDLNEDKITQYAQFIKKKCQDDQLLPYDKSGAAAIAEYGVRLAGRKNKISTEFIKISNLISEAAYWAKNDGSDRVSGEHVKKAVDERIYRHNLMECKIQELINQGVLMIDIDGSAVGQVNGLSVHDMGDYAFGRPSKITAVTSLGRAGIINIEREADLSGSTHDKGVLILSGYLRGKYAQDKPLAMSASICFEQSYSGIDGDSASSTEVYALLSSLSDLPLRQDIAVTGSVNQKGEIQPIGGVNEKIEGFFQTCKIKGLTGQQGVMIPLQNVEDLMLRDEIIEAVKAKKFFIYAVKTIDEGIEILTGKPAGERADDGSYPEGTINNLVSEKLRELAEWLKKFGPAFR